MTGRFALLWITDRSNKVSAMLDLAIAGILGLWCKALIGHELPQDCQEVAQRKIDLNYWSMTFE